METDRLGLPLSTSSPAAAECYRAGVDAILAAWPGAADHLDRAIAQDPDFALAWAARARLHQMYAEMRPARAKAARALELSTRATAREHAHVATIATALGGDGPQAIRLAEAHVASHQRDALVLSLLLGAFGLYAFSGRPDHDRARVDVCERLANAFGQDWWFLGYHGWALTEAGELGQGRSLTEASLSLRENNANAAHALAHVLYEQGAVGEGEAFIGRWLPGYGSEGILYGHIHWHQALLALEKGDIPSAIDIYEAKIRPGHTSAPPLNSFTDSASLLWRATLETSKPDDQTRIRTHWSDVTRYAVERFPSAGLAFADVHVALLAAGHAGRPDANARIDEVATRVSAGKAVTGPVVADLMRGLVAFADGNFRETIALLEPSRVETVRIGGSHAQRDLIEETLIVACLEAGEGVRARDLIDQRLHRRPSLRDQRWRARAE